MGSRIRENPEKIFQVFVELGREVEDKNKAPILLQKFPESFSDEALLKKIVEFAFPSGTDSPAVEHYSFVWTDAECLFTFGFCRLAAGGATCICIISYLPWFEVFYKLLNDLADLINRTASVVPSHLLRRLLNHTIPSPGTEFSIRLNEEKLSYYAPDLTQLPTIPENRNLTEYYTAVDANNMITIFASMLNERRILVTSRKLSRVTACVHASAALLYPMYWQGLYIPLVPAHLLEYCCAPMPFLMGLHSTVMEKARKMDLGDAVILDADNNEVTTPHDDVSELPQEIVTMLRKRLKAYQVDRVKTSFIGDGVSRSFVKALAALMGSYRDALCMRPGERISFSRERFVVSRPSSWQPCLGRLLHLQTFEQFIEDRLARLNEGQGFTDEFEMEANLFGDHKHSSHVVYRQWLDQMKKQTKKGKEVWQGITSKVKDRIQKIGPDGTRKPQRPPPITGAGALSPATSHPILRHHDSSTRRYNKMDVDELSPDAPPRTSADDFSLPRISINLFDDPAIQGVYQKSYSMEDLYLAASQEEEDDGQGLLVDFSTPPGFQNDVQLTAPP